MWSSETLLLLLLSLYSTIVAVSDFLWPFEDRVCSLIRDSVVSEGKAYITVYGLIL